METLYRISMAGGRAPLEHLQEVIMNNLNSILIEGNLVREPLLRSTPKGTPICTFRLASNRFLKQDSGWGKEVSYFDVEAWSRLADACHSLGHKGRGVRVVGRLKEDRWNSADGKAHSRITIVAEHVEFRPEFKDDSGKATEAAVCPDANERDSADVMCAERELESVTF
jgi:single-strand DNA-binding protein